MSLTLSKGIQSVAWSLLSFSILITSKDQTRSSSTRSSKAISVPSTALDFRTHHLHIRFTLYRCRIIRLRITRLLPLSWTTGCHRSTSLGALSRSGCLILEPLWFVLHLSLLGFDAPVNICFDVLWIFIRLPAQRLHLKLHVLLFMVNAIVLCHHYRVYIRYVTQNRRIFGAQQATSLAGHCTPWGVIAHPASVQRCPRTV